MMLDNGVFFKRKGHLLQHISPYQPTEAVHSFFRQSPAWRGLSAFWPSAATGHVASEASTNKTLVIKSNGF